MLDLSHMLYNTLEFALFYLLVFLLYWGPFRSRIKAQNVLILLGSYFFYGWWDWRFLSLIVFSSLVDYFAANQIKNLFHHLVDHSVGHINFIDHRNDLQIVLNSQV